MISKTFLKNAVYIQMNKDPGSVFSHHDFSRPGIFFRSEKIWFLQFLIKKISNKAENFLSINFF